MRRWTLVLGFVVGVGACAPSGAASGGATQGSVTADDGFVPLLQQSNGRYHEGGWKHYGPGYFVLDPQTGVLESHGGMGLFWYSAEQFSDFVLELDFKTSKHESNSGVFLRVPEVPTSDDYIYHAWEIQIDDAAGEGIHRTGAAYDAEAPSGSASRPTGEWNHFRISFIGDHITVQLNGEQVLDWDAEPRGKVRDFAARGYVGLQNHDRDASVWFRNIRIKDLAKSS